MAINTPVAFIIFNRPDVTERVFQVIRDAQPQKLLVISDGPRGDRPGEAERCAAARAVIDQVDWECEVLTNYSDTNLGCKHRVSSGIDWVFSQVEEAIILEDDCLPAPSFFQFCQTLLEKYRYDNRIMMVSGSNFQPNNKMKDSYYFSDCIHIWGWATWRRAWQHYDVEMASWPTFRDRGLLKAVCHNPLEADYWQKNFDDVSNRTVDTWDHQWVYACWQQSGMSVTPAVNLVSNIGFRHDATHTFGESPLAAMPIGNIYNIKHPIFVLNDQEADDYVFSNVFGGRTTKFKTIADRVVRLLAKLRRYWVKSWMAIKNHQTV